MGELLFEALSVALHAAERTGGAVDPTIGNAIAALGYDADLEEVQARPPAPPRALGPVAGYLHVQLIRPPAPSASRAVSVSTWARRRRHWWPTGLPPASPTTIGSGTLVSLGGDVAVAGRPPAGGWAVGIARESSTPAGLVDQVVAITHGGLASSATSVRAWTVGDRQVHHIVDPRTGDSVAPYWVLVSATGTSCVEANIVTTAAIVWGEQALDKLAGFDQSLRLVRFDGEVFSVHGWPLEAAA